MATALFLVLIHIIHIIRTYVVSSDASSFHRQLTHYILTFNFSSFFFFIILFKKYHFLVCLHVPFVTVTTTGIGDGLIVRGLDGPTEPVTWGTDVFLHCRYELRRETPPPATAAATAAGWMAAADDGDGEQLYAVKWFRGRREFFRYQPKLKPPVRLFPIQHVHVDVASSSAERIVLRRVGRYKIREMSKYTRHETELID